MRLRGLLERELVLHAQPQTPALNPVEQLLRASDQLGPGRDVMHERGTRQEEGTFADQRPRTRPARPLPLDAPKSTIIPLAQGN
jgi:hypothetical protein